MPTATTHTDDITVTFECVMERNDYGVPGSPVWYEPDPASVKITSLEILGVDVNPDKIDDNLYNALLELPAFLVWETDDD